MLIFQFGQRTHDITFNIVVFPESSLPMNRIKGLRLKYLIKFLVTSEIFNV